MPLSHGRSYLAIPGPSVMPDRVIQAMMRPAPNIYEGELIDMVPGLTRDLKAVARTSGHVAIYAANGHGGWEAAASNIFAPGDAALVLMTGAFAHGWIEMVEPLGVDVQRIDFGCQSAVDPAVVETALRADTGRRIRAVLIVQVDTATSIRSDLAGIRQAIDAAGHPALLVVDSIACLACDDMQMDAWGVDVVVAGCQKGLMTPPGLAFVFFNDRAAARRDALPRVSRYWDWTPRVRPHRFYDYFGGTAPTHHLFALRTALDMIQEEGLDAVLARHARLARAVWAAVDIWGDGGVLSCNVADSAARSHAVTTVVARDGAGDRIRAYTQHQLGLTLGIGLGMADGAGDSRNHFRIGHMGHVNGHMILGALGAIETSLKAQDIPHGDGALAAASSVLAQPD